MVSALTPLRRSLGPVAILATGAFLWIATACSEHRSGMWADESDDATAEYLAEAGMNPTPATGRNKTSSSTAHRTPAPKPQPAVMTPFHYTSIDQASWAEIFNDSNKYQYPFAEKYGISPIHDVGDAYYTRQPLVKITDGKSYGLDSLTHSVPFLVPRAAKLLADIGDDYVERLRKRGITGWRMKVTSVLRTPSSVKSLRRVNINATDSSTHQFATTFDISHVGFCESPGATPTDPGLLKTVLAETLLQFRRQERCMVKYESKTHCFHVTVTK